MNSFLAVPLTVKPGVMTIMRISRRLLSTTSALAAPPTEREAKALLATPKQSTSLGRTNDGDLIAAVQLPPKGKAYTVLSHAVGRRTNYGTSELIAVIERATETERMALFLLRREGWSVNATRLYWLYGLEGLAVRTKPRRKLAARARVPAPPVSRPTERWSMDFVSTRLLDGRWFRTLTVLDLYTPEALALVAERSLTGVKVAAALTP